MCINCILYQLGKASFGTFKSCHFSCDISKFFAIVYTGTLAEVISTYINSNSLCIIPIEISALVQGNSMVEKSWGPTFNSGVSLHIHKFTLHKFVLFSWQDIVIWSVMTSKSQAREVAMRWIVTVAGVNPLVRIFRRAFGVEVCCWLLCLKRRKGKKHVLVICKPHLSSSQLEQILELTDPTISKIS